MLGELIARLDRPEVAAATLIALGDPELMARIESRAAASGSTTAQYVARTARRFVDRADDDQWLRIVGIMGRADDPGLAALRAILRHSLEDAAHA